eukprot:9115514-Ditylum_brightwellii.AAC.1
MKHHIKTSAGVLHASYSNLSNKPKYGEGQGKTSLPSNWLFTSCSLLATLHSLFSGIYLSSVCGRFTPQRVAEAYVDDTDAAIIDQRSQSEETLSSPGQNENCSTNMGKLTLWVWRPKLARALKGSADLEIMSGRSPIPRRIQCLDPDQPIKQFRVLTTPLGNFTAEYERRKKISVALVDRARKPFISPKNAYKIYHNVWLLLRRYPLAVTTFTQQQCLDIMKPVVQ